MLCDQLFVAPALLQQLASAHNTTGQPIVAAQYGEVRGVPVLFGAVPLLHQLLAAGAAQLLHKHPGQMAVVPGNFDVDTPEQYAALLRRKTPGQFGKQ